MDGAVNAMRIYFWTGTIWSRVDWFDIAFNVSHIMWQTRSVPWRSNPENEVTSVSHCGADGMRVTRQINQTKRALTSAYMGTVDIEGKWGCNIQHKVCHRFKTGSCCKVYNLKNDNCYWHWPRKGSLLKWHLISHGATPTENEALDLFHKLHGEDWFYHMWTRGSKNPRSMRTSY